MKRESRTIAADARARLEAIADPAVKAGSERYFKHAVPFVGVRAPQVREISRALLAAYGALPIETLVDAALLLLGGALRDRASVPLHERSPPGAVPGTPGANALRPWPF